MTKAQAARVSGRGPPQPWPLPVTVTVMIAGPIIQAAARHPSHVKIISEVRRSDSLNISEPTFATQRAGSESLNISELSLAVAAILT